MVYFNFLSIGCLKSVNFNLDPLSPSLKGGLEELRGFSNCLLANFEFFYPEEELR